MASMEKAASGGAEPPLETPQMTIGRPAPADFAAAIGNMVAENGVAFHHDSDDEDTADRDPSLVDGMAAELERTISHDGSVLSMTPTASETAELEDMATAHSEPTDRYGFFLSSNKPSVELPVKEVLRRREKEKSRAVKWQKMLQRWSKYAQDKPIKLKRRIRKGIPDIYRGSVWNVLGQVNDLIVDHPNRYRSLCEEAAALAQREPENDVHETIERDITRTFPRHQMFTKDRPEGRLGLQRLRKVLRAYAAHDPEVGYCQGMGFFTAMFLIYMPEEQAFWQLVSVMHRNECPIRGLYLPNMLHTHMALNTMKVLVQQHVPKVSRHFERENIEFSMFATHWYLTIYSSTFPFDLVTRVWDCFLAEGFKVVHRVAIALLKCFQPQLLERDFEGLMDLLHHTMPTMVDPDLIMEIAFKIPVKKVHIQAIEDQFVHQQDA